jgi:nitrite reductase (NADH) large subunit
VAGQATGESIVNPDRMFADNGIELIKDRARDIDPDNKLVTISDGSQVPYDKLVLAMGSKPIIPPIPGNDLSGVFTLRPPQAGPCRIRIHQPGDEHPAPGIGPQGL